VSRFLRELPSAPFLGLAPKHIGVFGVAFLGLAPKHSGVFGAPLLGLAPQHIGLLGVAFLANKKGTSFCLLDLRVPFRLELFQAIFWVSSILTPLFFKCLNALSNSSSLPSKINIDHPVAVEKDASTIFKMISNFLQRLQMIGSSFSSAGNVNSVFIFMFYLCNYN